LKRHIKKAIDSLLEGKISKNDLLEILNEHYNRYQTEILKKDGTITQLKEKLNFLEEHLSKVYEEYKETFQE